MKKGWQVKEPGSVGKVVGVHCVGVKAMGEESSARYVNTMNVTQRVACRIQGEIAEVEVSADASIYQLWQR